MKKTLFNQERKLREGLVTDKNQKIKLEEKRYERQCSVYKSLKNYCLNEKYKSSSPTCASVPRLQTLVMSQERT